MLPFAAGQKAAAPWLFREMAMNSTHLYCAGIYSLRKYLALV